MATMLGGVALPRVYVQESELDWAGKPIRRWTLRTRPLTWEQYAAIEQMVREVGIARTIERAVDGTPHVLGASQVGFVLRSEEHTSELQSRPHLVCRLLLEKKKTQKTPR